MEQTKKDIEVSYRISTIIACDIAKEYAGGLATIYKENDLRYLYNKCRDTETCCEKTLQAVSRDISEVLPHAQEHIERCMSLIYRIVGMEVEEQELIHDYINTLKK